MTFRAFATWARKLKLSKRIFETINQFFSSIIKTVKQLNKTIEKCKILNSKNFEFEKFSSKNNLIKIFFEKYQNRNT